MAAASVGAAQTGRMSLAIWYQYLPDDWGAGSRGVAQGALDVTIVYTMEAASSGSASATSRVCIHAGRHGDEGRGGPADGLHHSCARWVPLKRSTSTVDGNAIAADRVSLTR
jgi:hypothetical protein